jgi:AraC-like DNA-binding protein
MSLPELARRSFLSASRLSRLFKQQTGVSLATYRNRQRLDRFLACYDGRGTRTLLDAALEAGFGSYAQFHRVFKALTGRRPSQHRRS